MRVLIVEDHQVLAHSLAASLRGEGVETAVATADSAEGVVTQAREQGADLVLLDLELGEPLGDGRDLIAPLSDAGHRVLVLTGVTEPRTHAESLEAGAVGVLTKDASFDELLERVRVAASGDGEVMDPVRRQQLLVDLARSRKEEQERLAAFARLTPTEARTLAALMDGRQAEQIAGDWVVSVATVRSHIRSLLRKLGVNSQLAAVAAARKAGWQPPEDAE